MELPHPLPDALIELLSHRMRTLGEPLRIRLVDHLRDGEASVQELTDRTETTQQNVSKHLGVLYRADMLTRHKAGRQVWYRLADDDAVRLLGLATTLIVKRLEALAGSEPDEAAGP